MTNLTTITFVDVDLHSDHWRHCNSVYIEVYKKYKSIMVCRKPQKRIHLQKYVVLLAHHTDDLI